MVSGSGDAEGVGLSAFAERTEAVDARISADSNIPVILMCSCVFNRHQLEVSVGGAVGAVVTSGVAVAVPPVVEPPGVGVAVSSSVPSPRSGSGAGSYL